MMTDIFISHLYLILVKTCLIKYHDLTKRPLSDYPFRQSMVTRLLKPRAERKTLSQCIPHAQSP